MVAQALVQGLAVVLQSGEIEFPASIGAPKWPDGEVETAAGVEDQPLDRIGAAEGLAGAIPFPQGLCWLEAALGKDRAASLRICSNPAGSAIGWMRRCFQDPSGRRSVLRRGDLFAEGATSISSPQPSLFPVRVPGGHGNRA